MHFSREIALEIHHSICRITAVVKRYSFQCCDFHKLKKMIFMLPDLKIISFILGIP